MRITLYLNSAAKEKKTGVGNYELQLYNTLKSEHHLDAIMQTDRRISLYTKPETGRWQKKVRYIIHQLKLVKPACKSIFLKFKNQQAETIPFWQLETKNALPPLNNVYNNFTKLYIDPYIIDTLRFSYALQKRAALVSIPNTNGTKVFWLTKPEPVYMNHAINICTIHDVFNSHQPMSANSSSKRYIKIKQIVQTFDLIFAISAYTKQQLIDLFPDINPEKIKVVYQALPEKVRITSSVQEQLIFLNQLGLQSKNYLLHVGSTLARKNQQAMIKAYLRTSLDIPLIIVGKKNKNTNKELLTLLKHQPNVIWLNYLADEQVNILYQHATAFIFPSLFEGFGIPILEAFYHDCPILTAASSALPEVAGDAALYVNPYSIDDIARGITQIAQNKVLQQQLVHKGREQLKQFTPEAVLAQINQILVEYCCQ